MSEMTKGRLPHLLDLVPDKVLPINGPYLKNIVFTLLNQNGTKSYEYKLVMENSTPKTIRPRPEFLCSIAMASRLAAPKSPAGPTLLPGKAFPIRRDRSLHR